MKEISPSDLILVGKVTRSHGTGGLLKVFSYACSEASFTEAGTVFVEKPSGEIVRFRVLDARLHKGVILLRLEGVDSISLAEDLRGSRIFVAAEVLSREDDEAFWFELLGLAVYLETGEPVGEVAEIIPTPAHDIYVVRGGGREYLIPGVHEVVKDIDLRARKMVIRPPEGLLEMNEV